MVSSIVAVVALTRCALLLSMYDLKAVQINVQSNLIQSLLLYKLELCQTAEKGAKNICRGKGLVWFYGLSTIVTPNPFLNICIVLFQTNQFSVSTVSISKQFYFKQFSLVYKNSSFSYNSVWHQYLV